MRHTDLNHRLHDVFVNGKLPTMVYVTKQSHNRKTIRRPLHRHEFICELLLIYEGQGTYHIGEKSYALQEGSVIFYNQGDLHELENQEEKEIGDYCVGITDLHLRGLPAHCLVAPEGPYVRHSGEMFPILRSFFEQIYNLEGSGPEGELAAQLLCSSLILMSTSLETMPATFLQKRHDEKMAIDIQRYLDQHYREDISLNAVADALNCSVTHVSHIFKKSTGSTPIQYVINRRIGHAQTMLISTEYTATQIATMVGYDNTNYFSTQFSKIVGMSPARYREFYRTESKGQGDQT